MRFSRWWHRNTGSVAMAVVVLVCMICAAAVLGQMTGCTALETERGRLRTAIDTWATVKHAAADAWEAGRLDRGQKKTVMEWTRKGDEALELWRTRLEESGPTAGPREKLLRATRILRKVWLATRDTHDGEEPEIE